MKLKAIFVSDRKEVGNNPDNIVVSPRGGILLCEDGVGSVDAFGFGTRLLGVNVQGDSFIFCKNNVRPNHFADRWRWQARRPRRLPRVRVCRRVLGSGRPRALLQCSDAWHYVCDIGSMG